MNGFPNVAACLMDDDISQPLILCCCASMLKKSWFFGAIIDADLSKLHNRNETC